MRNLPNNNLPVRICGKEGVMLGKEEEDCSIETLPLLIENAGLMVIFGLKVEHLR